MLLIRYAGSSRSECSSFQSLLLGVDESQFVERDPNKRLGYRQGGGGFEDIKSHPWFKGIDWDALYNKQVVPPFEPDVSVSPQIGFVIDEKYQSKRANFDATHELEELLLEENPLKARKRKEGQDIDTMSPEMRMMEEQWVAEQSYVPSKLTHEQLQGV